MTGPIDLWRPVADKWADVYGRVRDADWETRTPCSEWTVRDLIEHNLEWQATGGAMLGAATKPGDDWETIREAYSEHLSDPSNLEGAVDEFAGIPRQQLAAFLIGDLLIHSWDLARSIGYYESVIGLRVIDRSGKNASLGMLGEEKILVELNEVRGAREHPRRD